MYMTVTQYLLLWYSQFSLALHHIWLLLEFIFNNCHSLQQHSTNTQLSGSNSRDLQTDGAQHRNERDVSPNKRSPTSLMEDVRQAVLQADVSCKFGALQICVEFFSVGELYLFLKWFLYLAESVLFDFSYFIYLFDYVF